MKGIDIIIEQFAQKTGDFISTDIIKQCAVLIEQIDKMINGEPIVETLYALPASHNGVIDCVLYTEKSRCILGSDGDIEEFVVTEYELFRQ